MQAIRRFVGWRCMSALATVLSSAALASAQFSTANPLPKGNREAEVIPIAPAAPAAPVVTAAPAAPPTPVKAPLETAPAAVHGPRVVKTRWLSWPKLFVKTHKIEDPCDHCGNVSQSAEELQRIQSGQASLVEIAAAKIKVDEAAAPGRRAAIKYLASVKCHYFPEAEAALVAALRADRNECVRLDAAQALAECCCCTPRTMEALLLAVSGGERDGNPAEVSERVKSVANLALQRYAARGMSVPHPEILPPAAQQAAPKELQLTSYTMLPAPVSSKSAGVTDDDRRFATSAGIPAPSALAIRTMDVPPMPPIERRPVESASLPRLPSPFARTAPSSLPTIRLQPIGVVAP